MAHQTLKLVIGGSREGTEYRFVGDAAALRQLASDINARLDGTQPRPWKEDQSVILCEEATHRGDTVFLTFQIE
jgi:hypothetical protein